LRSIEILSNFEPGGLHKTEIGNSSAFRAQPVQLKSPHALILLLILPVGFLQELVADNRYRSK
jgi:hypothetical protein